MPYVVAEPCINCLHTDCVEACPKGIDMTRWISTLKREATALR